MLFQNNVIDTSQLPAIDEVEFKPLMKKYKILLFVNSIILFSLLFIIVFVIDTFIDVEDEIPFQIVVTTYSVLLLLFFVRLLLIHYGFSMKGYLLREHDIIYKSGLINHKIIAIPYNRVQHSEIRQSYLARLMKIAKIRIYTAGGSSSDLSIHGLSPDVAQQIKDYLSKTISEHE